MQISTSATSLYRSAFPAARSPDADTKVGNAGANPSRTVSASDDAKPSAPVSFRDSARAKLDADYAKAIADGTRVVVDTSHGGRHLDVSGLSDRELAAVAKGQGFTHDEGITAQAELAQRMGEALAPFSPHNGDQARAIKAMYPALPQDVKDALGWNEAMLEGGDRIIAFYEKAPEPERKMKSLFERMLESQNNPKALRIDPSLIQSKGGTINATA